jgi:hypothetical protein
MARIMPAESTDRLSDNYSMPRCPSVTGPLVPTWNLKLGYAKRLVTDILSDKMALQPAPEMYHAASVPGHMASTADMLGAMA